MKSKTFVICWNLPNFLQGLRNKQNRRPPGNTLPNLTYYWNHILHQGWSEFTCFLSVNIIQHFGHFGVSAAMSSPFCFPYLSPCQRLYSSERHFCFQLVTLLLNPMVPSYSVAYLKLHSHEKMGGPPSGVSMKIITRVKLPQFMN